MKMIKIAGSCVFLSLFFAAVVLADVKVAPVPWVPGSGDGKTDNAAGIKFAGVPSQGEIDIYTISGNLVWKQVNMGTASTLASPILWSGKNISGNDVASGVYLWVVKSPAKTEKGKLIVVR